MRALTRSLLILLAMALLGACAATPTAAPASDTETRLITHAEGETAVPMNPQRIVALDSFFTLTPLVEFGAPVVGAMTLSEDVPYPGLTAEESAGIENIGTTTPNLESIAALKPDLIIGVDFAEAPYEQLSQIAPTVILDTSSLDWKAQHLALGEATGRVEAAQAGIAEYEARVAELKERLPDLTVSFISNSGETPLVYLSGDQAWAPIRIMDDLGIKRPEREYGDDFALSLSPELLPEVKGDVLLYTAGYPGMDDPSRERMSEWLDSPLWQEIPAVGAGRAYQVDGGCWEVFGGLRSANCVLDEIEKFLLEGSTSSLPLPSHHSFRPVEQREAAL